MKSRNFKRCLIYSYKFSTIISIRCMITRLALFCTGYGTVLLLSIGFMTGCNKSRADATTASVGAPAIPVNIALVERHDSVLAIRAMGILGTTDELKLSFKIGGIIESVAAREGETVRKGQTLAYLFQDEINAQVAQAEQAVEKAKRDMERIRSLHADNALTLEQVQNATTAYEVARSQLRIATFNRQYATIIAPAQGKILKVLSKSGELTAPGNPIIVMNAESSGWVVRLGVSDRDIVRIQKGNTARVLFDAFPGNPMEGVIQKVGAFANPLNGTFEVEVFLKPMQGIQFVTGLTAMVEIRPSLHSSGTAPAIVPIEAVVEGNGLSANVYSIINEQNGRAIAKKIPVQIAYIQGVKVVLQSELESVSVVITNGAAYIQDGSTVQIIR